MLLWCWRRVLRVPWTARRSNHSNLKKISPECSLERLMLKLKLQSFGHLMWRTDFWKDPDAGKDGGQEEKGMTEGEMASSHPVGWHHLLNGHEFGWTLGVGGGQEGLACCSPCSRRVGHDWATELNWRHNRCGPESGWQPAWGFCSLHLPWPHVTAPCSLEGLTKLKITYYTNIKSRRWVLSLKNTLP